MSDGDSPDALEETIGRYNDAWNDHDLDAIIAMHADDMVFENHTAGESAQGADEVREHIGSIFETWPDIHFETRRLYVRDGVVTQEWTASATHTNTMRRGDLVAEPTGNRIEWRGHRRDPVRGRPRQAQGRLLGLGLDPAPGRAAGLVARLGVAAPNRCVDRAQLVGDALHLIADGVEARHLVRAPQPLDELEDLGPHRIDARS